MQSRAAEMTPLFFIFLLLCDLCEIQADAEKSIVQDTGVVSVEVGKNVTLHCSCLKDVTYLSWYRQSMGGKLELIFTRMEGNSKVKVSESFGDRFVSLPQGQECTNHLTIKELRLSDSGTYFCGVLDFNTVQFGPGAFLHVRTSLSNAQAEVLQPTEELLQPGDSLKLNCTVSTDTQCAEKPRFYWIEVRASELITTYPSDGQCTDLLEAQSHKRNCSLQFEKQTLNSTDAGTYYCVVTFCDEIIYGDGTRVLIREHFIEASRIPVYCLSVAFAVSVNVLFLMTSLMYRWTKKLCSVCKGTRSRSTSSDTEIQDKDSVYYRAINLQRNSEQSQQVNDMETACVYSRVKIKNDDMANTSANLHVME